MIDISPVLITGFRRPDLLENLLNYLARYMDTSNMYIAVDGWEGAKEDYIYEIKECHRIAKNFQTLGSKVWLHESNLGCYLGNKSAISWFFDHVDAGIVLEDDIWPTQTFLIYCTKALEEYKEVSKIGSISGTNIVPRDFLFSKSPSEDFRLSKYSSSWGWATWKDRWCKFISEASLGEISKVVDHTTSSIILRRYWKQIFNSTYLGETDSWAYRWLFTHWSNEWCALTPNVNLVENLGFGELATHTTESKAPWWVQEAVENLEFMMPTPQLVVSYAEVNSSADGWLELHHFRVHRNYYRNWLELKGFSGPLEIFDRLRRKS